MPVLSHLAAQRQKPWGTAQAVYAARQVIDTPFAVINADDFYGAGAYQAMAEFLTSEEHNQPGSYAMMGYRLRRTLSEHGHVTRGICQYDENAYLNSVVERLKIIKKGKAAEYLENDQAYPLTGNELVSMNMWGFRPCFFEALGLGFEKFLQQFGDQPKTEFLLPSEVDRLIQNKSARVKVLPTDEDWFGVTYREDRPKVVAALAQKVATRQYPHSLWQVT